MSDGGHWLSAQTVLIEIREFGSEMTNHAVLQKMDYAHCALSTYAEGHVWLAVLN